MTTEEKIDSIRNHIQNVERNSYKLGKKLIIEGEIDLGVALIANGLKHDNSKFFGIEFEHLYREDELMKIAAKNHALTNPHHPEHWGGIHNMPDLYIAEMVCDCTARSSEFGDNVFEWFSGKYASKHGYTKNSLMHKKIERYLKLLLDKPF